MFMSVTPAVGANLSFASALLAPTPPLHTLPLPLASLFTFSQDFLHQLPGSEQAVVYS